MIVLSACLQDDLGPIPVMWMRNQNTYPTIKVPFGVFSKSLPLLFYVFYFVACCLPWFGSVDCYCFLIVFCWIWIYHMTWVYASVDVRVCASLWACMQWLFENAPGMSSVSTEWSFSHCTNKFKIKLLVCTYSWFQKHLETCLSIHIIEIPIMLVMKISNHL